MLGACTTSTPRLRRPPPTPAPSVASILADWVTITSAVEVGAAKSECVAAPPQISPDGLQHRYRLKHVSGRTGVLLARTAVDGPDPRTIELSCEMGPLRDPALEADIIANVSHRLQQLRGVGFAPIDP
ncbi:MAG TPA: hypothetical protein PKE29_09185 [Phycisphaerales bacterium]|nr:hypothetical protein [Phycisphaerales bacterium]